MTLSVSGSATGRVLAFDGYYEATENLNVQITTPGGTVIGPITLGGINAGYPGVATANVTSRSARQRSKSTRHARSRCASS